MAGPGSASASRADAGRACTAFAVVAFFLLGASGDRRRQLLVGGLAVTVSGLAIAASDESAVSAIGWTVAALLFGELTNSRQALLHQLAERANRAEAEREREADRVMAVFRSLLGRSRPSS